MVAFFVRQEQKVRTWRLMLTHDVATSDELSQAELESYTALFELLSQIDQRLMDEDSEYREKYSAPREDLTCK